MASHCQPLPAMAGHGWLWQPNNRYDVFSVFPRLSKFFSCYPTLYSFSLLLPNHNVLLCQSLPSCFSSCLSHHLSSGLSPHFSSCFSHQLSPRFLLRLSLRLLPRPSPRSKPRLSPQLSLRLSSRFHGSPRNLIVLILVQQASFAGFPTLLYQTCIRY